jgi:signal peptidase I
LPRIARTAYIVAFLLATGTALSALAGQISSLPFALIPLVAGIGIVRGRVWSAWGFALYTFAQMIPVALALIRSGSRPTGALGAIVLAALVIPLFLFAGRSLAAAGAPSGLAWPWITVSALTTLPVFLIQVLTISTGAMEDTLLPGDHVLVQRFPKPKPAAGDMVVLIDPIDRRRRLVMRVIGVPEDRIGITGNVVFRNGATLDEPYAVHAIDDAKPALIGELVVPEGKYFVLGDNRNHSRDSRDWGFVDSGDLIGKPLLIYDSEEQSDGRRVRWNRLFKIL